MQTRIKKAAKNLAPGDRLARGGAVTTVARAKKPNRVNIWRGTGQPLGAHEDEPMWVIVNVEDLAHAPITKEG